MKLKRQLLWHAAPMAFAAVLVLSGLGLWLLLAPGPAQVGVGFEDIPFYSLPYGPDRKGEPRPFWPSRLTSATGMFTVPGQVPASAECGTCHQAEYTEWTGSIHAIADRDLVYEATVDANVHLLRSPEQSRFCEGCHAPSQMLAGRVTKLASVPPTAALNEGVACISCHTAIHSAPKEGNGALTLAYDRAAASGPPGAALLADPRAHLAAYAAPDTAALMKSADLCGACHTEVYDNSMSKATTPQPVQSTFGEWQGSWYARNGVTCQDCHMAADPAGQITALRTGKAVKPAQYSHRFIGSNHLITDPGLGETLTLLRGGLPDGMDSKTNAANLAEQSRQTQAFLRAAAGLELRGHKVSADRLHLDLAVQNLGAGHNLPTGVNDQKHMWLELTLTDAQGHVVYQSGAADGQGAEDPDAVAWLEHFEDAKGKRITNHLTFATAAVKWLRDPVPPRGEQVVSYDVALARETVFPLHLRARLLYRVALPDLLFKNLGHRAIAVPAFTMTELAQDIAGK